MAAAFKQCGGPRCTAEIVSNDRGAMPWLAMHAPSSASSAAPRCPTIQRSTGLGGLCALAFRNAARHLRVMRINLSARLLVLILAERDPSVQVGPVRRIQKAC